MAFRPAKDNFGKDEVIDILKSNVQLYKNEPEFVEYIVNLAMYLLDQKYGGNDSQDENMMIPPTGSFMIQDNNEMQDPHLSGPTPIKSERERMPPPPVPLNRMPSARPPGVPPAPPPGRPPIPQTPPRNAPVQPPSYQFQGQIPLASPTPVPVGPPRHQGAPPPPPPMRSPQAPPPPGRPPQVQQERAPLSTPMPDMRRMQAPPPPPSVPPPPGSMPLPAGSSEAVPKINVSSLGKTRVYKMVRSYNSETAAETPCKICGTKIAVGERQCPGCGHIL